MSDQPQQPDYTSTFCPILSHAVLRPSDLKKPDPLMILPISGAVAPIEEPGSAEYIGCQGPSCAFFLRGENKCCIPLLTQAASILIAAQLGQISTQPQQH